AHPTPLPRDVPRALFTLRRKPERGSVRLPGGAGRRAARRPARARAREVTGRGGGKDGRTQAPNVGEQARQASLARRAGSAPRHRLSAVWRGDTAPPGLPTLRDLPRPKARRG